MDLMIIMFLRFKACSYAPMLFSDYDVHRQLVLRIAGKYSSPVAT
jgi:hypothetical protein